jgi:hypothetical protein
MRRIGMLMAYNDSDSEAQVFVRTFVQGLAELGWIDGRNVQMDLRWAAGEVERMRALAKELVVTNPDVIVSNTTPVTERSIVKPRPSRSYSRSRPIQSVTDSLRRSRARAAISLASLTSRPRWEGNGLSCSRRRRRR